MWLAGKQARYITTNVDAGTLKAILHGGVSLETQVQYYGMTERWEEKSGKNMQVFCYLCMTILTASTLCAFSKRDKRPPYCTGFEAWQSPTSISYKDQRKSWNEVMTVINRIWLTKGPVKYSALKWYRSSIIGWMPPEPSNDSAEQLPTWILFHF